MNVPRPLVGLLSVLSGVLWVLTVAVVAGILAFPWDRTDRLGVELLALVATLFTVVGAASSLALFHSGRRSGLVLLGLFLATSLFILRAWGLW